MNAASITKISNGFTKKAIALLNENLWTHNTEAKGKEGVKKYINLVSFLMLHEFNACNEADRVQFLKSMSGSVIKDFNDLKLIIRYSKDGLKYKGCSLRETIEEVLTLMGWTKDLSEDNIYNQDLLFMHQYTPYNYYLEYAIHNIPLEE